MSSIREILIAAEDDIRTILQHKDNTYFRNLMEAAYLPEKKLNLPFGEPPYKENAQPPEQTPPGIFWQIAKNIQVLQRKDIKSLRQETIFIEALEALSGADSKILLAVKDQMLYRVFKGLKYAALVEVGYFAK
jgi:hypothetical protein